MPIKKLLFLFLIAIPFLSFAAGEQKMLTLKSTDFQHNGAIPSLFTCYGQNVSPELHWSGIPQNAKSLVLIVDDPDAPDPAAPKLTWVHWLLYNIPVTATALPKAVTATNLPEGTLQGKNDWKKTGYGGPCPPIGQHRYFHKLYALDIVLPDLHESGKVELEKAMTNHIIEKTELIGVYQRNQ